MYPSSCCAPTANPSASPPDGDAVSSGGSPGKVALKRDRLSSPLPVPPPAPSIFFFDAEDGVYGGDGDGDSMKSSPAVVSEAARAVAAARCGQVRDFWPTLCFSLMGGAMRCIRWEGSLRCLKGGQG